MRSAIDCALQSLDIQVTRIFQAITQLVTSVRAPEVAMSSSARRSRIQLIKRLPDPSRELCVLESVPGFRVVFCRLTGELKILRATAISILAMHLSALPNGSGRVERISSNSQFSQRSLRQRTGNVRLHRN